MITGDPGDIWSYSADAAPTAPDAQSSSTAIATAVGIGFCLLLLLAL